MRYLIVILSIVAVSCQSQTAVDTHIQAVVEYHGSDKYEGTYQFTVVESTDIPYDVIEIDMGNNQPQIGERCMNLEPIELRDYMFISYCD